MPQAVSHQVAAGAPPRVRGYTSVDRPYVVVRAGQVPDAQGRRARGTLPARSTLRRPGRRSLERPYLHGPAGRVDGRAARAYPSRPSSRRPDGSPSFPGLGSAVSGAGPRTQPTPCARRARRGRRSRVPPPIWPSGSASPPWQQFGLPVAGRPLRRRSTGSTCGMPMSLNVTKVNFPAARSWQAGPSCDCDFVGRSLRQRYNMYKGTVSFRRMRRTRRVGAGAGRG